MLKKPEKPKQAPRNWWLQGVQGWTEMDGSFYVPDKPQVFTALVGRDGRRITAGFELDIWQRVSRDPQGRALVAHLEGHADNEGWLRFYMYPVLGGKRQKPFKFKTHRDGIPGGGDEEDD